MFTHTFKTLALATVLATLALAHPARAFEDDDVETSTEEAVADSDATSEQSRLARKQAADEQRQAFQRTHEAEQMKVRADQKAADAAKSLAASEAKIAEMKAEAQRQLQRRRTSEGLIAREELKLREMTERMSQAKTDLDQIIKSRADADAQYRELQRQMGETKRDLEVTGRNLTQARADLKRRVDLVRRMDAEVSALKVKYKSAQNAHAAETARVAQARETQQVKFDQLTYARAQVRAPAARPQSRGGSPASAATRTNAAPGARSMVLPSGDQ